jgi:hypothetical protein
LGFRFFSGPGDAIFMTMTKLFEQAIAKVLELPESGQDAAADALFAHLAGDHRQFGLTAEQSADVTRIRDDLREGKSRLAGDEEMETLWKKCGL